MFWILSFELLNICFKEDDYKFGEEYLCPCLFN